MPKYQTRYHQSPSLDNKRRFDCADQKSLLDSICCFSAHGISISSRFSTFPSNAPPPASDKLTFCYNSETTDITEMPINAVTPPIDPPYRLFATTPLWNEFLLLRRIMYKNRNQHRHAKYFHELCLVERCLERCQRMEQWLTASYFKIVKQRHDKKEDQEELDNSNNEQSLLVDFLGYLNTVHWLILKTTYSCVLTGRTIHYHLHSLRVHIALMHVVMALLARVWALLDEWSKAVQALFAREWRKANEEVRRTLKSEGIDPERTFMSKGIREIKPVMLIDQKILDGQAENMVQQENKVKTRTVKRRFEDIPVVITKKGKTESNSLLSTRKPKLETLKTEPIVELEKSKMINFSHKTNSTTNSSNTMKGKQKKTKERGSPEPDEIDEIFGGL